jgi:predicted ATP-dependent serine protease
MNSQRMWWSEESGFGVEKEMGRCLKCGRWRNLVEKHKTKENGYFGNLA